MRAGSLWDSDLVAGVAFRPQRCAPSQNSAWTDSTFAAGDGARLAYRLYKRLASPQVLLIYFHANAELCTDLEGDVHNFFECGFSAVLCPEYRGFAWSEGKPSLRLLYPDSEALMQALPSILESSGIEADVQIVLHGRSLGSACAIHLAAQEPRVSGLIVESGVMELLKLPMVMQIGMMVPQMLQALRAESCPLKTLDEIRQVKVPTLIIHGDQDEISPVEQALSAHGACGSTERKLIRYPRAGHNDLRFLSKQEYFRGIRSMCDRVVTGDPEALAAPAPSPSWLSMITDFLSNGSALKCLPGMRRCFVSTEDAPSETPRDGI